MPIAASTTTLQKKTVRIGKSLEEWMLNTASLKDKGINLMMETVKVNRAERGDLETWANRMQVTVGGAEEPKKKRSKKS